RRLLGLDLVAHRGDGIRIRADEDDACLFERPRKGFALRQKSVAGMDRFRAGLAASVDDLVDREIALGRLGRPDQHSLIRHLDMQSIAVSLGIDGDSSNSHAPGRLDDPTGDLAAICDQDFLEHVLVFTTLGGLLPPNLAWGADVTIRSTAKPG